MINIQEFLDDCTINQKQKIINILIEDGIVSRETFPQSFRESLHDEFFRESLNTLITKRHMLSLDEENYINDLAKKYK